MMPWSPMMTASAWSVVSTMQIVRSEAAATAAGEVSTAAPSAISGSSFLGSMSCTTKAKPTFNRLCAIGPPMLPRPMNPTLPGMASSLSVVTVDFSDPRRPCPGHRPGRLLRRPSQIAARFVLPHEQRGDDVIDLSRADGPTVLAADTGVHHVDMPEFPRETALFESHAIVPSEREGHAGQ